MLITAEQAKEISDAVNNGDPIDPALIDERDETGNLVIDESIHAIIWAARTGLYEAYLSISKFPDTAVDNAIEVLEDAGYVVDTTRLQSYKELLFSWI